MKNTSYKYGLKSIVAIVLLFFLSGCSDYFTNPLVDKDTGEDINLLIIDFNFFTTSMTYKLLDSEDGSQIDSEAKINFTGKNGNDIVTFAGEKKVEFYTSQGQMELTLDPNIQLSPESPVEFAVHVEVDGYNSLAKGIQFQTEGKKTFELYLTKTENEEQTELDGSVDFGNSDTVFHFFAPFRGLKSATEETAPYEIDYSVTIQDLLKFKDNSGNFLFASSGEIMEVYNADSVNFIALTESKYTNHKPGIELVNIDGNNRNVLFQKIETGGLVSLSFGGRFVDDLNGGKIHSVCSYLTEPEPTLFGFFEFKNSAWNSIGKEVDYLTLNFQYTLAKIIEDSVCEQGAEFSFVSNVESGFSIDADLYDTDDNFISSISFKGNFPEKFVLENIPWMPVKVVFRNNNPAFKAIPPLEINDPCEGSYEIEVMKKDNYVEYQIILKALCRDNPSIGIAPTYNVEFKLKDSDGPWQGATMEGGVLNLLGIPNQEYQIRLSWEGEWEYSSYFTEFDAEGNYLGTTEADATIESKIMDDGRIQISIEKIFNQDICDDLGW